MPLTYNFNQIHGWEKICLTPQGGLSPTTSALIWSLHAVHVSRVSEKNYVMVFERISMLENVMGPAMRDGYGRAKYMTLSDIHAHIGLYTNVATKTDLKVNKDIVLTLRDRASQTRAEQENSLRKSLTSPSPLVV
jgi:hypothetical protein